MPYKPLFGIPVVLSTLLVAATALAQDAPPPAPPPPPGATPPGEAGPGAMPPGEAGPGAMPPGEAGPGPTAEPGARFRWGISGLYGRYLVNGLSAGLGGLDLRFGAQLSNQIGVYGSPVLVFGAGASGDANSGSAGALALYGVGALADYTISDMVFFAAGPELLSGGYASVSGSAAGSSAAAEAGTFFGVQGRVGLALGSVRPNRRQAFTIGVDFHAVFTSKTTLIPVLALGYDSF